MVKIIGTHGCSRCLMAKDILENKNIEYEYVQLEDLPQDEKDKYMNMAQEIGLMTFPIIIKDSGIITFQELVNYANEGSST